MGIGFSFEVLLKQAASSCKNNPTGRAVSYAQGFFHGWKRNGLTHLRVCVANNQAADAAGGAQGKLCI